MSLQFERVDVLIVGAGLAAVTVALHLPHSLNVLVVSKHEVTSANSDLAQGGIASSYLEPSSVDHERDTLVASKLAAVPDRVYTLVEEGRSAIRDLERFGVVFDREGAEYAVGREGAHGMNRIFHVGGDETGRHVMATLRRQLPDNVTVMEHVLIDSLVKTDDRVTGATGFNGKTRLHVQAGAVVLATGGIGGLIDWTSNCRSVTGDGLVLADEVGARLKNLSRIQFHPTLLAVDSPHLVTEALRGAGATVTSSNAHDIVRWALEAGERILFLPDQHLGRNTAYDLGVPLEAMAVWDPLRERLVYEGDIEDVRVILWKGHCSVHEKFNVAQIEALRKNDPERRIIVHPECTFDVVQAADEAGSTSYIIDQIEASAPGTKWAVGTEMNLVNRLAATHPELDIISLNPYMCPCLTMNRIDLPHLLWALESLETDPVNVIRVDLETTKWATLALERMLAH